MTKEQIINLIKTKIADLTYFIVNRASELEFPMTESEKLFRTDIDAIMEFEYWDSADLENHNFDLGGYTALNNLLKEIKKNG